MSRTNAPDVTTSPRRRRPRRRSARNRRVRRARGGARGASRERDAAPGLDAANGWSASPAANVALRTRFSAGSVTSSPPGGLRVVGERLELRRRRARRAGRELAVPAVAAVRTPGRRAPARGQRPRFEDDPHPERSAVSWRGRAVRSPVTSVTALGSEPAARPRRRDSPRHRRDRGLERAVRRDAVDALRTSPVPSGLVRRTTSPASAVSSARPLRGAPCRRPGGPYFGSSRMVAAGEDRARLARRRPPSRTSPSTRRAAPPGSGRRRGRAAAARPSRRRR